MSNTFITCSIVAKEALAILENMLDFSKNVNRSWEAEYASNVARGYMPGTTIKIKRPPRFTYRSGATASAQAITESSVDLTLAQGGCDLALTSLERTLSLSRLEDTLRAALSTVANEIDRQGLELARTATQNVINTDGAHPSTQLAAVQLIANAQRRLDEVAAPRDRQRYLTLGPGLNSSLVAGFSGLFNAQSSIGKQNTTGLFSDALGLNIGMSQNVSTQAACAATASNINGAGQTGASITVAATGGGAMPIGTMITLPGVYAVNPLTKQSTGVLRNFVLTAETPQGGTTLAISPSIVTSGALQNCSASPTNTTAFVILGTVNTAFQTNVAYHKDAFTLAMVPMWAPPGGKGVIDVAQETHNGFTIKATEFYDGTNDKAIIRLDVLFGWAATYPDLAVKIYST